MRRAYKIDAPGQFEIREEDLTPPGPGEVLLRVRACGICGSDLHSYRNPERWVALGRSPGHEVAGEVAELGPDVEGLAPGDRVALQPKPFCGRCEECRGGRVELCSVQRGFFGAGLPGGFAEYLTVPAQNLFRLPEGMEFALGALAEPLAVAVHGHRMAAQLDATSPSAGERVVVLGGGVIGLLCVFYARQAGAGEVAVSARHAHQADAARRLGATRVFDAGEEGGEELRRWSEEHPIDLVIETVGGEADTLEAALAVVRRGGRICVLGVFGAAASLSAQGLIRKQARIVGSVFYGYVGMHHDYDIAIELLRRFGDVLGDLITHRVPLDDVGRGYALAADKSNGSIKVTVEP